MATFVICRNNKSCEKMPKIVIKSNTWSTTCLEKETLFLINLVDIYYKKKKCETEWKPENNQRGERKNYCLLSIFAIAFY